MTDAEHPQPDEVTLDTVRIEHATPPRIVVTGSYRGAAPSAVSLTGSRQHLTAELETADGTWRAGVPLLISRWGSAPLAPRSGAYRLQVETGHGVAAVRIATQLPAPTLVQNVARIAVHESADPAAPRVLMVDFTAPLTAAEFGPEQQSRLEAEYRSAAYQPLNAVFFESFFGQSASCNPLAIDRALAELRPDIARYWSVADASVAVPEARSPFWKAANSGGASAAAHACSWSTTGCARSSRNVPTRRCCRPGTAPC